MPVDHSMFVALSQIFSLCVFVCLFCVGSEIIAESSAQLKMCIHARKKKTNLLNVKLALLETAIEMES